MSKSANIDEYIASFPKETQRVLEEIRALVKQTVPEATETISYDMPTFRLEEGYLVHFAAFKKHIGFYPAPTGSAEFEKDLSGYKTGKGSLQLPLDKPMPTELIVRILEYNLKRTKGKSAEKKLQD